MAGAVSLAALIASSAIAAPVASPDGDPVPQGSALLVSFQALDIPGIGTVNGAIYTGFGTPVVTFPNRNTENFTYSGDVMGELLDLGSPVGPESVSLSELSITIEGRHSTGEVGTSSSSTT